MSSPLLLNGNIDGRDELIESLNEEVEQLKRDLSVKQGQVTQLERENAKAISALRRQLSPLYMALQQVFGVMDTMAGSTDQGQGSSVSANPKWESIKSRLQPRMREAIDILLTQGPMKRTQLASAMRMDYSNCNKNVIGALLRQGLLVDTGRELSLKQL